MINLIILSNQGIRGVRSVLTETFWIERFEALKRADWRRILIGSIILTFLLSAFVPIYVDELVYKLRLSRTLRDGALQLSFFPQCADTFVAALPWPLVPGGAVLALVWQNVGLLGMRLASIAMFGLWLCMLWLIIRRSSVMTSARPYVFLAALSFLTFGVTAYAMVISRPDQFVLLVLTASLLLALVAPDWIKDLQTKPVLFWAGVALVGISFCLLTSIAAFSHPAIIYYLPFLVASVVIALRVSGWPATIAVILAVISIVLTGVLHHTRVLQTCAEPSLRTITSLYLVDVSALSTAPFQTLSQLVWNAVAGMSRVLANAIFADSYQSSWLPPTSGLGWFPPTVMLGWAIQFAWHALIAASIVACVLQLANGRWRAASSLLILGILLVLCLLWQFSHAQGRNFTTMQLGLPLLILFSITALGPSADAILNSRWRRSIAVFIAGVAISSAAVNAIFIAPQLVGSAVAGGLFNPKQHHSYTAWNQGERDAVTHRLAKACNIRPRHAPDLVLDDVSYYVFRHDKRPMFATYVDPNLMGSGLKGRLQSFLAERKSSGFIGKCNYLPHELQSLALRDGEACCVSASALGPGPIK